MFQGCSSTKNLPGLVTQRFVPAGLVGLLNVVTGIFVDSAVCTRTEDEVRKKQLFLGNGGGWIRIVLGSIRFTDLLLLLFTLKPPLWPCASTENHRAHLCFSSKKNSNHLLSINHVIPSNSTWNPKKEARTHGFKILTKLGMIMDYVYIYIHIIICVYIYI